MKKIIAGVLAFLLVLMMTGSEAFAITTAEKEKIYKSALEELESYLENPGDPLHALPGIISAFESLNNFQYSRKLFYYTVTAQFPDSSEVDSRELSVIVERSAQPATAKPTARPTAAPAYDYTPEPPSTTRPTTAPAHNPTTPPATPAPSLSPDFNPEPDFNPRPDIDDSEPDFNPQPDTDDWEKDLGLDI